jgi:hypothetical protein
MLVAEEDIESSLVMPAYVTDIGSASAGAVVRFEITVQAACVITPLQRSTD